jgi:hypothetical protein
MIQPFIRSFLFAALLFCLPAIGFAQTYFVEGRAVYSIFVNGPGAQDGADHYGTYTIIIKGSLVRKEITMNNGFQNILIYDRSANSALSIQADKQLAIQLDPNDLKQKLNEFEGFRLIDQDGTGSINGLPGNKARVVYKDGSSVDILYSRQWTLKEPWIFDRFPGITYFPLSFDYKNEEGIAMRFKAEKIEAGPVESALFRIPSEYKIISHAEYRKLNK